MPETTAKTDWTEVLSKSLAYLCLARAEKEDADRVEGLANKMKFLQALGLPQADAAYIAGSTPASAAETLRLAKKKEVKNGKAKKAR
jgi:hypothetical protein